MGNLALWTEGSRAYGSSIAYANYSTRINDGEKAFSGSSSPDVAWSSASENLPQWAAVVFPTPASVHRMAVYWGRGGDFATSRRCRVEVWVGAGWKRAADFRRPDPEPVTEVCFEPVTCQAVRLYQEPGWGPAGAPNRMQVAELEAHGAFVHGPKVAHLEIRDGLRAEWERNYGKMRGPITRDVLERMDRSRKTRSGTGPIGPEERDRARRNIERAPWARKVSEGILADADWWLDRSDESIYEMIPTENPRAISPSYERGCPLHGGGRRCMQTSTALPYRWQCVEGGEWWYNGAKVQNPGTGRMVEVWDDGDGWAAPPGFPNPGTVYHFHSAWRYYVLSRLFFHPYEITIPSEDACTGGTAIRQLAHAYAITGDERYAHKAGVMLNRLAEVYRSYNGTVDEQRPLTRGYLVQVSWEEWPIHDCVAAYDVLRDALLKDRGLLAFFEGKGTCDYDGDGKTGPKDLRFNIEHNLFGYMYEWLHRAMAIQTGDYIVREGLVLCAIGSMMNNREMIKEAVDGPFGLAVNLTNNMFRDGKWWYDSPGYSIGCITGMSLERMLSMRSLRLMDDSRLRLRKAIEFHRQVDCDGRLPGIGDTGGGDSRNRVLQAFGPCPTEDLAYVHDRDERYLERLLGLSGGDVDRIRDRYADWKLLFHAEPLQREDPAPFVPRTVVFHDSGFAILRTGTDLETRKHIVLNFGKGNPGHGHRDKLAVNVIAFGYDLSSDLGYPTTFTHKKVDGWEKHTISHATVCVDGATQAFATGSLELFGRTPGTQVICAAAERAYPGLVRKYERTLALVDAAGDQAYVFDVFEVEGGHVHDYVFRGPGSEAGGRFELALPGGGGLTPQNGGTLAGEAVAFGEAPGFGYIKEVSRGAVEGTWSATWRVGDAEDSGLRLTMLGEKGREVITGKGEGYGFYGKSPWETCVSSRSTSGRSIYAAILEPFQGRPFVRAVQPLAVEGGVGVAVALEGRIDYLIRRMGAAPRVTAEIDGRRVEFDGAFARVTVHGSCRADLHLVQGTFLRFGESHLEGSPIPRGRVDSVDPGNHTVVLSTSGGGAPSLGDTILFRNPAYICNSSYEIITATSCGSGSYRVEFDMPINLSEGRISGVSRSENVLETTSCLTKLEMCPGLFDGKVFYVNGTRRGNLAATPGREAADRLFAIRSGGGKGPVRFRMNGAADLSAVAEGDRFLICDLDAGDEYEVMSSAHAE